MENQDFEFGEQEKKAIYFRGSWKRVPRPGRASAMLQIFRLHTHDILTFISHVFDLVLS